MNRRFLRFAWLLLIVPAIVGLWRVHFGAEVLDLLPNGVPAVEGVKLYQQHFSNSRELIITIEAAEREEATKAAQTLAENLRADSNQIAQVIWQPPWQEHPEQTTELIAHLWLNQPPEVFQGLRDRLVETNLAAVLQATRDELSTTLSPMEIARLSYDPFGLTRLPDSVSGAAPGFGQGGEVFASPDGKFRILFVQARDDLKGYRECTDWLNAVRQMAHRSVDVAQVKIGYTGRPAFVAEISGSMKQDIVVSVVGTSVIIAILFWIAHRRWKPMLWLLTLLALILAGTLGLGGLLFGTINVVSMGFAAILLGLAVDYAVVHYQEALAHPDLSVPEIRRAIAPSIFWAATTTITAFIVLNFGGLPGLAQLGSLVGIGVALSACVMIFAFLPPLFPERMAKRQKNVSPATSPANGGAAPPTHAAAPVSPLRHKFVFAATVLMILLCVGVLLGGFPKMDASNAALQPRNSEAYAALDAIKNNLNEKRDPLWLVVAGRDESEVAEKLAATQPVLNQAVSNGVLAGFMSPALLWPQPAHQVANRTAARELIAERAAFHAAAKTDGFSPDSLGLADGLLDTWQRAISATNVFWPTNELNTWIFSKLAARSETNQFAVGFLFPPTNGVDVTEFTRMNSQLPRDGVWLAGWELLGGSVLKVVKQNLWKLVLPMIGLVFLSLWFAFRRVTEIALSLGILLLSGLCLLAVMKLMGWSWNLLNLMAIPLILGTGVDYSLFMQLALRRHHGDLQIAHRSVGRALLLCGATAVSGFGSLGFSSNAGMAGLGQVCAVGIASNMLISVYLLPVWWRRLARHSAADGTNSDTPSTPSSLYGATCWRLGMALVCWMPASLSVTLARMLGGLYWRLAPHRRAVVIENLLPVVNGKRQAAEAAARRLFANFAAKVADLWRYESGATVAGMPKQSSGWEHLEQIRATGRGALLLTPHLGNWEFGAPLLVKHGIPLLVLTQPEPGDGLTELRQQARARWGVETLVVNADPFAFLEVIKRLQAGAVVALLVDRPPAATAVTVELFGQPFRASIAAAELARATGCALLPVCVLKEPECYAAHMLPEVVYDRAALGDRAARQQLTQEILRAFEPIIRQHPDQWYHFVPVWPNQAKV